jgi:hypothetical protein
MKECGALCVYEDSTCTETVKSTVQDVFYMVGELVKDGFEGKIDMQKLIENAGSVFLDLATFVCDDPVDPNQPQPDDPWFGKNQTEEDLTILS